MQSFFSVWFWRTCTVIWFSCSKNVIGCKLERHRKQNKDQFEVKGVYFISALTQTCTPTRTLSAEACGPSLHTLWFGQWASPVARASSIDPGLAPFSGRPPARPTQTRLHAGRGSTMEGWAVAQTWRTQTKEEKVQDKHIFPHTFKDTMTSRWQQCGIPHQEFKSRNVHWALRQSTSLPNRYDTDHQSQNKLWLGCLNTPNTN